MALALLALAGVSALGGGGWGDLDPLGVVFALGAAAGWAFYILSSARVGRVFPKLDGLALAMTAGALLSLPFGITDAGSALLRLDILAVGAAVAVLSSTIPYAFELIVLRRLPAAAFAILMSLAPATAALAGFVFLGQTLTWLELAGIALVITASIGAVRSSARAAREAASRLTATRRDRRGSARQGRPRPKGRRARANRAQSNGPRSSSHHVARPSKRRMSRAERASGADRPLTTTSNGSAESRNRRTYSAARLRSATAALILHGHHPLGGECDPGSRAHSCPDRRTAGGPRGRTRPASGGFGGDREIGQDPGVAERAEVGQMQAGSHRRPLHRCQARYAAMPTSARSAARWTRRPAG